MSREIAFRAWTGKRMMYQGKQYLASFIRRAVVQINLDHGCESFEHEAYLPNGGNISDYLMESIGRVDDNDKEIYEGDVVEHMQNTSIGRMKRVAVISDIRHLPDFSCSKEVKVIGNLRESPELADVETW